tara:strand:- start:47 stop:1642 length:1596 start_codon:yes stop_codon:yes gene_type:complete
MIYINQFFSSISKNLRKLYLNSNIYDRKISKRISNNFFYKPSPHLLTSLIKYQKKIYKIDDLSILNFNQKNLSKEEFDKFNSFNWFLSLDLKSKKNIVQSIILNWIDVNKKFNSQSWDFEITAKRIIAWLSSHNLTFENCNENYKLKFNSIIQKQTNHLINEIKKTKYIQDKIIGCVAIVLVGLCYKNEKNYLSFGMENLRKISKISLDNSGFPKSRNTKQLILFLKYFILIREWFKESQNQIPEYIDETIFYLGQAYAFMWQNVNLDLLFNGNINSDNVEFDNYLKRLGYKFKNENHDFGGYIILKDRNTILSMDVGSTPNSEFTKDYQSGALSFEIVRKGKKLISNCGYYNRFNKRLNQISKSTASQSTLTIDDHSSNKINKLSLIDRGLKIIKKEFTFEKNFWKIEAAHDGYSKNYGSIHERKIEFFPEKNKFIGIDKIIKKKKYNYKFDIRFHFEPNIKLMKTQDNKTILIELDDEGWKFTCENFEINIDNGLYFGNKNSYTENQNIYITGVTNHQVESIKWEITKI